MSGAREADEKFSKAREFLQEEDYEAAVSLLSEAIALNPRMVRAYRARAIAFEKIGNLNDARIDLDTISSMENAASLPPGSPSPAALVADERCSGLATEADGHTGSGQRDTEEWVGRAPWNPLWFWPQAILFGFGAAGIVAGLNYRRLSRPGLMWPTILISIVAFVGVVMGLAFVDIRYGARTAFVINAPAALILYLLQRGDYERVKVRIPAGVGGGLDLPLRIGVVWLVLLLAFVLAVSADSTGDDTADTDEYIRRVTDWDPEGESQRAIADFDEAIKLAPQDAHAYYLRGIAYNSLGQPERAIQDFDEAIRLDPQVASVYFSRGVTWGILGEFQRAKSDYDEVIRLDPQDASGYHNRAIVHARLGMDREAQRDADQAAALGFDPSILEIDINAAKAER